MDTILQKHTKRDFRLIPSISQVVNTIIRHISNRYRTRKAHVLVEEGSKKEVINLCKSLEQSGMIDLSIVDVSNIGNITKKEIGRYTISTSRILICSYVNPIFFMTNNLSDINMSVIMMIDYRILRSISPEHVKDVDNIIVSFGGVSFYSGIQTIETINRNPIDSRDILTINKRLHASDSYKRLFLEKLSMLIPIIGISDFNSRYNLSFTELTAVIFGEIDGALSLSFVSAYGKRRIRLSFASSPVVKSPKMNIMLIQGCVIMDFVKCTSKQQTMEWVRMTIHELSEQYPRLMDEVKLRNMKRKPADKCKKVRFSTRVYFTPTKRKSTFPKPCIRKTSKYR